MTNDLLQPVFTIDSHWFACLRADIDSPSETVSGCVKAMLKKLNNVKTTL